MNLIFIDQIPTHWSLEKLSGYILNEKPKKFDGNKNYFSTFDVRNGVATSSEKVSFLNRPSRADILVRKGDIIQSKMKDSNKALIIDSEMNEQLVSTGFFQMRSNEVGNFLYYWIQSDNFLCLRDYISTGSTQKAANLSDINSSYVPIPPENEKIATFLNKQTRIIQTAITKLKQKMLILEEKRSTLITQAVTKGLNPKASMKDSGIKWLGSIPEHWGISALKFLVSAPIIDGPHLTPIKLEKGVPFISAEAISAGYIDFGKKWGYISESDHEVFSKRYSPRKGDILMVKLGATTGTVAMVDTDMDFSVWVPLATIRIRNNFPSKFIFYFLQSSNIRDAIQTSWTHGTQQTLGLGTISNLSMPTLSSDEANEIVAFIESKVFLYEKAVDKYKQLILLLQEYRTSLISALVTGKIDVRTL